MLISTKTDLITTLPAAEFNQLLTEFITNIIGTTGQTAASGTLDQIAKGIAQYAAQGGVYCVDSGAADAYVLAVVSPFKSPTVLRDGMKVSFRAGNANTGASTVDLFGFTGVDLKKADGTTALDANDIPTDSDVSFRYDLANTAFILEKSTSGYQFNSIQTFTSSGTWTPTAGTRAVLVDVVGAGGGGSGAAASRGAAGAGAGGYSRKFIISGLGATETVTIGAGGAGGASGAYNIGGIGGTSSFGSHLSATGGQPTASAAAAAGGVGSGGDINIQGSAGQSADNNTGNTTPGGSGGSSFFGGAAIGQLGSGVDGTNGGGGSGAHNNTAGGAGGAGLVIVYEYI